MDNLARGITYPHFTQLQAEKNPHFVELLKDLRSSKLGRNFITKTKEEELHSVSKEFTQQQTEYETKKVLYDSIWSIVADPELDDTRKADVANALVSVELRQSLKLSEFDCKKESHLFGTEIEPEHLKDGNMVWAREQIKKKLSNRGAEILKQIGTDVDGCSGDLLTAKLNNLPNLISSRIEKDNQKRKIKEENILIMKEQLSKYTSTLLESLVIMEDLVEKHLIEFQSEQYSTKGQSLQVQCDALLLKIKSLHMDILCETYTKDTIPALFKISNELITSAEQTESEFQSSKVRLNRYESVGTDFSNLVDEYSQLKEMIKQKKWTIEKLQKYCQ